MLVRLRKVVIEELKTASFTPVVLFRTGSSVIISMLPYPQQ